MNLKKNQKCVRLTDEVLEIVSSYPQGRGFNEKFECLVKEYKYSEKVMQKKIAELDRIIDEKCEQIQKLTTQIRKTQIVKDSLDRFLAALDANVSR